MTTNINVTKPATPRNRVPLPNLYYVAMDDWLEKLGEKAFLLYLKLHTMVDRTDENPENHCIKSRQSLLIQKLDISKSTFLRLIKPLYEYGLIDLTEYEDSKNKGSKPVNIVVFDHPQNKFELSVMPLEKCRDWSQRIDEKYSFSRKGGRPKQVKEEEKEVEIPVEAPAEQEENTLAAIPEIKEEVAEVIKTEFAHFKEAMERNGADLEVIVNWVNDKSHMLPENQVCFIFKQIATYAEKVRNTATFITNGLKVASSFHRPVTAKQVKEVEAEAPASEYKRQVPFYNWLEDNDDMPY